MTEDNNLENKLRAFPRAEAAPGFKETLLSSIVDEQPEAGSSQGSPFLSLQAMAAAAVILIAAGLYLSGIYSWKEKAAQDNTKVAYQPATDEFEVLRTDTASQSLSLQTYDAFEVQRLKTGDSIGHYTLSAVSNDAFTLRSDTGEERQETVDSHNRNARIKLQAEIHDLQVLFRNGTMTVDHMQRLEAIAYYNEPLALQLLETIAVEDTPFQSMAEDLRLRRQQMNQIRLAERLAKTGDQKARLQAILALGKTDSPLAIQGLMRLAMDVQDDSLAAACVQQLIHRPSQQALQALQEIANNAKPETIRQSAAAAVDSILSGSQK